MTDENVKDIIMDLLNKSDLISVRIIDPTEDDLSKINKLYDLGFITSKTFTIPISKYDDGKVSCLIELGRRLEELK